jgi:outer membrane protein W
MRKLLLILLLGAFPSFAQSSYEVSAWVTRSDIRAENHLEGVPVEFVLRERTGIGIGSRRTFGEHWSLAVEAMQVHAGASLQSSGERLASLDRLRLAPLAAVAEYRFCRTCRIAPWLGAGAAWVLAQDLRSDDLEAMGIGRVKIEDKAAAVFAAGLDVPVASRMALALDARYLPLVLDAKIAGDPEVSTIDLDPLVLSVGLRVRF